MIPDATILARYSTPGRREPVRLIVLHTTESACKPGVARAVANWFAGSRAPRASAHYVVGPDELIACVPEEDTAWHAPPVNAYAIGVEQTGRAAFTEDEWGGELAQAMIDRSIALVACLCARHGIPEVFVSEDELVGGKAGITTHAAVSRAFRASDHTDPGPSFPLDDFIARVAALRSGAQSG